MMPYELYPEINKDTMEIELSRYKLLLDSIFGNQTESNFLSLGTYNDQTISPPEKYEFCLVQLVNDTSYGHLKIKFTNNSDKVEKVELLFQKPMPDKSNFYLFSCFLLLVILFNIYTIRRVFKSNLYGKWKWVLLVVFLNYPALIFSVMRGPYISWTSFLSMFGSMTLFDIENIKVMMALPLGAILVLIKFELIKRIDLENQIIEESDTETCNE
jgi:hypothetical protein